MAKKMCKPVDVVEEVEVAELVERREVKTPRRKQKSDIALTQAEMEFLVQLIVCHKMDLGMNFHGTEITFPEYYYPGDTLYLAWKGEGVSDWLFNQAWKIAQKKYTYCDGTSCIEDYDESRYDHRYIKEDVVYGHGKRENNYQGFAQVQFHYEKLCNNSPYNPQVWMAPYLHKAAPWCSLEGITTGIVNTLAGPFFNYATITSRAESYVGDKYYEVCIGHQSGCPLIWKYEYTWGEYAHNIISILDSIRVRLYCNRFEVTLPTGRYSKTFVITRADQYYNMIRELPWWIQKIWLNEEAPTFIVNSLAELGLLRNDEYSTEVYAVNHPQPGLDKPRTRSTITFYDLCMTAEENLKGEN